MLTRLGIIAILLTASAASAAVGQDVSREPKIKAAYLYNFGKYIEWPSSVFGKRDAPLVIGIVGPSDVSPHLANYMAGGKTVQGRPVQVTQWSEAQSVGDCHILFVSRRLDGKQRQAVISAMDGKPVLLVGDSGDVGQVRFVVDRNRMKVQIAATQVRARGLKVSSKLLQVAEVVD